jgi:hypothetical protein
MPQLVDILSTNPEGRIALAIQAINQGKIQSARAAAKLYFVNHSTLSNRLKGIPSRSDSRPKSQKLTDLEESVIVRHTLDLDSRGFSPRLRAVDDIANLFLSERTEATVSKNWASNFVKRRPELQTRFN